MVDERQVARLADDLLEDLRDDWVPVMAMVWSAERELGLTDPREVREVVTAALVHLLDDPAVKVVTGDMARELATESELVGHVREEWPTDDEVPVSGEVVWLVERDFELRQRDESSD